MLPVIILTLHRHGYLKRLIGAKTNTSGSATEVITGTIPTRIRIRELCSQEYLRIMCKDEDHCLRQLLSSSSWKGLCFSPLTYLSVMSKQLSGCLDGCPPYSEVNISASVMMHPAKVLEGSVVSMDIFG